MKDYLQRRLDAGTVWMGDLPREIRLPLTFAAGCAVYYLVYAVLLIFYLGQGPAEEYLRYEALLLGVIAVLSSLVGLAVAFRRGGESLVCARAALRQIRRPEIFLLWIWLVLAVLNSFLSSRFHGLRLLANRWQLMDVFLFSLLLCPLGFALARLRSPRLLWIGMDTAMILTAPLFFCGMWTVFTGGSVPFINSVSYIYRGRLALNLNPNITGAYAALFLFLGLYRLHSLRSRAARALIWLGEAVWLIALASSASRGNIIAAAVGLGFYVSVRLFRAGKKPEWKKILLTVLAGLAVAVLFYLLCRVMQQIFYAFQARAASHARAAAQASGHASGQTGVQTDNRTVENAYRLGGRDIIWNAIFKELTWNWHIWLHGCGPGYVIPHIQSLMGRHYYTHNQFLEILVGQGLAPMLLYLAWLFFIARDSVALIRTGPDRGDRNWTLPIVLLVLVVANLMEALLAGTLHYVGHLFFLIGGYVAGTWVPTKKKT